MATVCLPSGEKPANESSPFFKASFPKDFPVAVSQNKVFIASFLPVDEFLL